MKVNLSLTTNTLSLLIFFSLIITLLLIDSSINRTFRLIGSSIETENKLIFFYSLGVLFIVGHYSILKIVRSRISEASLGSRLRLNSILTAIGIVPYFTAVLLAIIAFQTFLITSYDPLLVRAIVSASYAQALFSLGFLTYKFLSWFKSGSKNYVLLAYSLAVGFLFTNVLFGFLYLNSALGKYVNYIDPTPSGFVPTPDPLINLGFQATSIASYIFVWIASVLVLHSHSHKLGKFRYWTTVSLPLIYFILQFPPVILQLFSEYRESEPITFALYYTIFFGVSQSIGGILFGFAFWSAGSRIDNPKVRNFLILSALGIILFFTSNQAVVLGALRYPPFGTITLSFLGVASYILLIGIYFTAASVTQDVAIRRLIRKYLSDPSFLVGKIAMSELEQQINKKVTKLRVEFLDQFDKQPSIEASLSTEDIRNYVDEVLRETKKERKEGG